MERLQYTCTSRVRIYTPVESYNPKRFLWSIMCAWRTRQLSFLTSIGRIGAHGLLGVSLCRTLFSRQFPAGHENGPADAVPTRAQVLPPHSKQVTRNIDIRCQDAKVTELGLEPLGKVIQLEHYTAGRDYVTHSTSRP